MTRSIRLLVALALLVALTAATISTASAGGRKVFSSTLVGISSTSLILGGLQGAGAAWTIDEGSATLFADGRLHVEVEGLVLTSNGMNPADTGRAVVSCNGAVVAMTDEVPFSDAGDAEVNTVVSLPSPCQGLLVFFTNSTGLRWFAVSGF